MIQPSYKYFVFLGNSSDQGWLGYLENLGDLVDLIYLEYLEDLGYQGEETDMANIQR